MNDEMKKQISSAISADLAKETVKKGDEEIYIKVSPEKVLEIMEEEDLSPKEIKEYIKELFKQSVETDRIERDDAMAKHEAAVERQRKIVAEGNMLKRYEELAAEEGVESNASFGDFE